MKVFKNLGRILFLFFDVVIVATSVFALSNTSIKVPNASEVIALPTDYSYENIYSGETITGVRLTGLSTNVRANVLEIPSELDGKAVLEIGDYAFSEKVLRKVEIPASVTKIGSHAFYMNMSLTSVTFAKNSSLTQIGEYAFAGYSAYFKVPLTEISLPASLTSVGEYAFYETNLHTVMIASLNQTQTIGAGAFSSSRLEDLFLYRSGVVALGATDIFDNIINNDANGKVQVHIPSAQSATYSSDANWSSLSADVNFVNLATNNSNFNYEFLYNENSITGGTIIGVKVTGFADGIFNGTVMLPSEYENYTVIEIGAQAFAGTQEVANAITSVSVPATVRKIGTSAFQYTTLQTVTFASESLLENIGQYAFAGLETRKTPITTITIPANVTRIGNYAFSNSTLTTATFEAGSQIQSMGNNTFSGTNLEELTLSNSTAVVLLNSTTFENITNTNSNRVKVYVPSALLTSYQGNSTWSAVVTAGKVEFVVLYNNDNRFTYLAVTGGYAVTGFASGQEHANVVIPSTYNDQPILQIAANAFKDKTIITSVSIPASVTSIASGTSSTGVFSRCTNLATLTFASGSQLTSIGDYAFYYCTSLTSITFASGSQLTSIGNSAFSNTPLTSITIPASVTNIGTSAFAYTTIQTITFEENSNLTSIVGDAFYSCTSLTSITIPSGVTSIGSDAFFNCTSLTSITFASGSQLTSIGDYAFYNCTSLTSITIPSGVTSIGNKAFRYTHLLDLYLLRTTDITSLSSTNVFDNITNTNGNKVRVYVPSALLTSYQGNSTWSAVVTAGKVEFIVLYNNDNRFTYSAVTGGYAVTGFASGQEHANVVIPSTYNDQPILQISAGAFYNKTIITSVTIPASVTSIASGTSSTGVFSRCTNLATLTFASGSQLTSIGDYAFAGAIISTGGIGNGMLVTNHITSITIPASVTSIGNNAFYLNTYLSSVVFEESSSLTTIGNYAFAGDFNDKIEVPPSFVPITSITIPASVTTIGNYAFQYTNLLDMHIERTITPIISLGGTGVFANVSNTNGNTVRVWVPSSRLSDYQSGTNWSSIIGTGSGKISLNIFDQYYTYSIVTGGFAITGIAPGATLSGSITLPNTVAGGNVVRIEDNAFNGNTTITKFTINYSMSTIGDYAFANMTSLTAIELTLMYHDPVLDALNIFNGCSNVINVITAYRSFENSQWTDLISQGIITASYGFEKR